MNPSRGRTRGTRRDRELSNRGVQGRNEPLSEEEQPVIQATSAWPVTNASGPAPGICSGGRRS
jgi:hypothetical protein